MEKITKTYFWNPILFSFLFLCWQAMLLVPAKAQAPNFEWAKNLTEVNPDNFNDNGNAIAHHQGHNFVTGKFEGTIFLGPSALTSSGGEDMFIARYATFGSVMWAIKVGGSGNDGGRGIAVDANGNILVTGYFEGTITLGATTLTSSGNTDALVAKFDGSGNCLWARKVGGTGIDEGFGIAADPGGNPIVTGIFSGTATFDNTTFTSNHVFDGFIAKYDPSGNMIWVKQSGANGWSIATDVSGNSFVTGSFVGTAIIGSFSLNSQGGADIFLTKYDAAGTEIWAVRAGGFSGDEAHGVAVDTYGNAFITGSFSETAYFGSTTLVSAGILDVFLVKYDSGGNVLWANRAGDFHYDEGYAVTVDAAGNSYITGSFIETTTFGSTTLYSGGGRNIFVAKYNPAGVLQWARNDGGATYAMGYGIAVNATGQTYVTGAFADIGTFGGFSVTSQGGADIFVSSYDANGDPLWVKSPNWVIPYSYGADIATDDQGNSYVVGHYTGSVLFGNIQHNSTGGEDLFIAKYNSLGEPVWVRSVNGNSIEGVTTDSDGNCYVTGSLIGSATFGNITLHSVSQDADVFVVKYDVSGNVIWATQAGGQYGDAGKSIKVDNAGNSYVTGTFMSTASFGNFTLTSSGGFDVFVAKLDPAGNFLWAKGGGGANADAGEAIAIDGAGNSYLTGLIGGNAAFGPIQLSSSGFNIFVAKYDPAGNEIWVKSAGGPGNDFGRGITADENGNCYVTGVFAGTATFGTITITGANNDTDVFIARYDAAGTETWAQNSGGTGPDEGREVKLDGSGYLYVAGSFVGTAQFGSISVTSDFGPVDVFVAKYTTQGNVLWVKKAGGPGLDYSAGLDVDFTGNAYLTGSFQYDVFFDNIALSNTGVPSMFVAKLGSSHSLLTGTVAATFCPGTQVNIPFSATGIYAAGNVFTAQLSDVSGNFQAPISIGSVSGNSSGTIAAIIPNGLQPGTGYRIRVVASQPFVIASDNGTDLTIHSLPVITTTANAATICLGESVLLTASGAGSYSWSAGNGLAAQAGAIVQATPTMAGTHVYTVTGIADCSSTSTVAITVNPRPMGSLTGSVSVCPSVQQVSYWFSGNAGTNALTWGVNGGTIAQQFGSDSITVNWGLSNLNAYVWAIPKNQYNCLGDTIKLPVTINVFLITPTPVGPLNPCTDPTLTQTYTTFHTNGSTYTWGITGGQLVSGNGSSQVQVQWQQPGQGQLWVLQQSITATDTCYGLSDTLSVQLLPMPDSTLTISGNATICAGYTGNYSLAGSAGSVYNWQITGGQILTGQGTDNITVQWPSAGNYTLAVTETNNNGCAGRQIGLAVQVNPVPNTVIGSAPPGVCPGNETSLSYAVQGLSGSSYNWQISGGEIQQGQGGNQILVSWNTTAASHALTVTETSAFGCIGAEIAFPVLVDNTRLELIKVTVDTTDESRVLVYYLVQDSLNYPLQTLQVQRQEPGGNFGPAGVAAIAETVFTDTGLQTGQQAFYYRLQGQNQCADELLTTEHATVWLQGQANAQTGLVQLSWTPYIGFGNQQVQYQVWRKIDEQESYSPVSALTTTATETQAILGADGFRQCFRVLALAADTRTSWSNSICFEFSNPLLVPNIITPNGDGKNDVLIIDKLHLYPNSELTVMNRWGKEVYRSSDYQNNWGGEGLPTGLYFYQLEAPGQPLVKGWIEVLR